MPKKKPKTKKKGRIKTFLITLVLLFVLVASGLSLVASAFIFNEMSQGQWACIKEECVEFATGEEWVKQNCNYVKGVMVCSFEHEGDGYMLPLDQINVSRMVSCKTYDCSTQVYIKGA